MDSMGFVEGEEILLRGEESVYGCMYVCMYVPVGRRLEAGGGRLGFLSRLD